MNSSAALTPFLLLFRNSGPDTHEHLSSDERQSLIQRWNAWYDTLHTEGRSIDGQPLRAVSRTISGPNGSRVVDGPFVEAKEVIGGYVKILATSLEEATAIAQRHPGLAHGLIIEVRQGADYCHLGIGPGKYGAAESAR